MNQKQLVEIIRTQMNESAGSSWEITIKADPLVIQKALLEVLEASGVNCKDVTQQKQLADRAFYAIDRVTVQLFEEAIVAAGLPLRHQDGQEIHCRELENLDPQYNTLYCQSIDDACSLIKEQQPLEYEALLADYGSEEVLRRQFNS